MPKEFPLNFRNKFEFDISGGSATPEWAAASEGISNIDPSFEDEVDDTPYWSGQGYGSEDVVGIKASFTFTGHRLYGDPLQDYIDDISTEVGEVRKTQMRWTRPDGKTLTGEVTISNIKGMGGDANAKSEFSFTATFNGKPEKGEGGTQSQSNGVQELTELDGE